MADDGSNDGTDIMLKDIQTKTSIPIVHVWHEDNGFKKVVIMNKAIAKTKGEYIIHIDGDMILDKNFIKDHLSWAEKSYFITGSRAQTTENLKDKIFQRESIELSFFTKGIYRRLNCLRLPYLTKFFLNSYKKDKAYFCSA